MLKLTYEDKGRVGFLDKYDWELTFLFGRALEQYENSN